MHARTVPQSFAKFFGPLRHVRKSFQQRADVQTGANGENRESRAAAKIGEDSQSELPIASGGCGFLWIENVNQVVRHSAALRRGWFGSADVEASIELRGIAGSYFSAELLSQPNAQR